MTRWSPVVLRRGARWRANVYRWASAAALLCAPAARFAAHAATLTVANLNDSGSGSLRQAILNANAAPGLDTIIFQIPGAAPHTLTPLTALPPLLDAVVIDGTTQPDFAGTPTVQLVGASAGPSSGLRLFAGSDGSTVRGLVINRFGDFAIRIDGSGSNVIQANFLGTDVTGTAAAGNGNGGVMVLNASGNLIGGTNAAQRNVISGGNNYGVYIQGSASGNTVAGNLIGTTATGTAPLGNVTGGVVIYGATGNLIGGPAPGAGNVISGNSGGGVFISTATAAGNRVQGNFIGTDRSGRVALGNGTSGVKIDGATANFIGGANAAARNVIAANGEAGVFLNGAVSNLVQGNFIGTDATGTNALGNTFAGVTLAGASGNVIGGPAGAGNVISGNQQDGVFLSTNSAWNQVAGNLIGLDATGAVALTNEFDGVALNNAPSNVISGNAISGNADYGVWILGANATGNLLQGNVIGTDATARAAQANLLSGVRIESPGNVVGGADPALRNIISGNAQDGVTLLGAAAAGNVVQGNFIGTDGSGTFALPNLRAGVGLSDAPGNLIGGAAAGAGNLLSGNYVWGLYAIGAGAFGNVIQGNRIGTDASGTRALGNWDGLRMVGTGGNTIGGLVPGAGNLISGNPDLGIGLTNVWWTTIQGNLIGTKADGFSALGNGAHGVEIRGLSTNNLVGGLVPGAGNRIAFSKTINGFGYVGVRVRDAALDNAILGNAIFANDGLGIDLGNYGVQPITACGSATGANLLENYPVLTAAYSGPFLAVRGSLNSTSGQMYRLQFFADPTCDPRGHGQGQIYLGDAAVVTSNDCTVNFSVALPGAVPTGYALTATATDPAGNTSEFSACVPVLPMPTLSFTPAAGGQVAVSWPDTAAGFTLVEADDLTSPTSWSPVANPPVDGNGQFMVLRPATNGLRFYALMFEIPAPPLPTLTLTPADGQQVALSWTNTATRFALEQTGDLVPPVQWSPVTNTPAVVNGQFVVTAPATNGSRFYRLEFQFAALTFEVPTPSSPILTLTLAGNQQIELSWTNAATRFALEQTDNLASPVQWSLVTNTPAVVNGQFVVTEPATNRSRFYRLAFH